MTGRYGLVIMRAIRIAGAATVLALGGVHRRDGPARTRRASAPQPAALRIGRRRPSHRS